MAFNAEGNYYIGDSQVTNTSIGNSYITNSTIDMNLNKITNLGTCTTDYDAANKLYVDQKSPFVILSVDLTGVALVNISPELKGIYSIKVRSQVINGPCALFQVIKSESALQPQINTTNNVPGLFTSTILKLEWDPNTGIFLRKTSNLFDGTYDIFII